MAMSIETTMSEREMEDYHKEAVLRSLSAEGEAGLLDSAETLVEYLAIHGKSRELLELLEIGEEELDAQLDEIKGAVARAREAQEAHARAATDGAAFILRKLRNNTAAETLSA